MKLPLFKAVEPSKKFDPLTGIAVVGCKVCGTKFVSYRKTQAVCSNCDKEKG